MCTETKPVDVFYEFDADRGEWIVYYGTTEIAVFATESPAKAKADEYK